MSGFTSRVVHLDAAPSISMRAASSYRHVPGWTFIPRHLSALLRRSRLSASGFDFAMARQRDIPYAPVYNQ
jgi:hypothetical protein